MYNDEQINGKLDAILQSIEIINTVAVNIGELRTEVRVMNQKVDDHATHLENCKKHMALIYGNGGVGIKSTVENHEAFISSHTKEHKEAKSNYQFRWILATGIATVLATIAQFCVPLFQHLFSR